MSLGMSHNLLSLLENLDNFSFQVSEQEVRHILIKSILGLVVILGSPGDSIEQSVKHFFIFFEHIYLSNLNFYLLICLLLLVRVRVKHSRRFIFENLEVFMPSHQHLSD